MEILHISLTEEERDSYIASLSTKLNAMRQSCEDENYQFEFDVTKLALMKLQEMCCLPTNEEREMLRNGDYCAEELFGVGGKKSCPKCFNK